MKQIFYDLLKIGLAILTASIVGAERKKSGKPIGMRTLSLVCIGSTLATVLVVNHAPLEVGRALAGIVTGVGFLGAGSIIAHGTSVRGLTTAAAVWAIAIIGVAIGLGEFLLALVVTLLIFFILSEGRKLESINTTKLRR